MIRDSQIYAMLFVSLASVLIIVFPFILYRKNLKGVIKPYLVGTLIFLLADLMIRYPITQRIHLANPVLEAIVHGLIATIILLFMRLFVLKGVLAKDIEQDGFKTAMVMGMGQAAIEAMMLGYSTFSFYQISKAINNGTITELVKGQVTQAQLEESISALQKVSEFDLISSLFIQASYVIIYGGVALMLISILKSKEFKRLLFPALILFGLYFSQSLLTLSAQSNLVKGGVTLVYAILMGYYIYREGKEKYGRF